MSDSATEPTANSPRTVKSDELVGVTVEVVAIDEGCGRYGDFYVYWSKLESGEIVRVILSKAPFRRRGVKQMLALLDAGEPVMATLTKPGKALLWDPFDLYSPPRISSATARRLRAHGVDVADTDEQPDLPLDGRIDPAQCRSDAKQVNEILNEALHRAADGWPVFPVIFNGKKPATANGRHVGAARRYRLGKVRS